MYLIRNSCQIFLKQLKSSHKSYSIVCASARDFSITKMSRERQRCDILLLQRSGTKKPSKICQILTVSRSTVYRTLKRLNNGERIERRASGGRPRKLAENQRTALKNMAQHGTISHQTNLPISWQRRKELPSVLPPSEELHDAGYWYTLPRKILLLTEAKKETSRLVF